MTGFFERLADRIDRVDSVVSVGLDPDVDRLPAFLDDTELPRWAFNRRVIDATHDVAACFKPNAAFYEDVDGWRALVETVAYAHGKDVPVVLDAKRGDVGHTARQYARLLDTVDAVTVSPYLGPDSLEPFFAADGGVFVLCRTSNPGGTALQDLTVTRPRRGEGVSGSGEAEAGAHGSEADDGTDENGSAAGRPLYEHVALETADWADGRDAGLVVGATAPAELERLRELVDLPFLVPGVGTQGGDAAAAVEYGLADGVGVVNASRSIIFAGEGATDEAEYFRAAGTAATRLKRRLNEYRS